MHHIRSKAIDQITMIHIHQAYHDLKETMDNFSAVMMLTIHYKSNPITTQALKLISTNKVWKLSAP